MGGWAQLGGAKLSQHHRRRHEGNRRQFGAILSAYASDHNDTDALSEQVKNGTCSWMTETGLGDMSAPRSGCRRDISVNNIFKQNHSYKKISDMFGSGFPPGAGMFKQGCFSKWQSQHCTEGHALF